MGEAARSDLDGGEPERGSTPHAQPRLVERRENSLLSLFELTQELGDSRDPFAIARQFALNLIGQFGSRRAAVWAFADPEGESLATLCVLGVRGTDPSALGRDLREAVWARAESDDFEGPLELPASAAQAGFAVAAPIVVHGGPRGVLALGERVSGEPFRGLDLDHVTAAARMLGVALEGARLYHRMAEANRQLRRANDDLVEAARLKSQFVANVNHEMRTPITVVLGFLDILSAGEPRDETTRAAMQAMTSQMKRLSRIVQDLLEYSRISGSTDAADCAPLDVGLMLARYYADRRPGVLEGFRSLQLEVAPRTGEAVANARHIERALDALVDNALKFTPPGARVTLRVSRRNDAGTDWVAIDVSDDGPGIPADQLPGLFEAFRQGDGSSTRVVGGMGLGLALARRLAEAMGGRLESESEPGRGATFRLFLRAA